MGNDQQPDGGSQQRQGALRYNQQTAAVDPVGTDAAIEAEKHKWPELKRVGDSKRQAGISQPQDQPILGRDLDPGANIGSDLCCEIDPEIGVPQADECCMKTMGQDLAALLFCILAVHETAPHVSSARQRDTGRDEDDTRPICFIRPLAEKRYCKQCRQRRHQSSKGCASRSAKDGNRTAIQKKRNDGHDNALEKRLNRNVGERQLREAGSEKGEGEGQIEQQRSGGDEGCRVTWNDFRLQHHHGETCRQECGDEEKRTAESTRDALAAFQACPPTMMRAPAIISESPSFRALENLSRKTIAATR